VSGCATWRGEQKPLDGGAEEEIVLDSEPLGIDARFEPAIAYSMIESAKSSGANVWEWLRYVIENIGQTPENRLSELLPDQWISNQQESTPN
jgi:hypothetical protein